MGGISKLSKIAFGTILAGSLFISSEISNENYFKKSNKENIEHNNKFKYEIKYNSNKKTLVHKIIEIQEEAKPNFLVLGALTKDKVDSVLKQIEKYIPKKPASEITRNEAKNLFIKMDSIMDKFIFKATAECYQSSLIYHSVGEHYNLPIHLVIAPPFAGQEYHSFARWDPDGKHDPLNPENPVNKGDFNWDNESKNFIKFGFTKKDGFPINDNDEYYIKEFYIPKKTIENKIYLKNLNEKEMLAFFGYWVQAEILDEETTQRRTNEELKKTYTLAFKAIDKAIKLDSLCVPCYFTKADLLNYSLIRDKEGGQKKTRECIDKAISLNNEQPELWSFKSIVYEHSNYKGMYTEEKPKEKDSLIFLEKAIQASEKSIELIRKRKETEFLKTNNPGGINYSKIYYLTEDEWSSLFRFQLLFSGKDERKYSELSEELSEIAKKNESYKQKAHERMERIRARSKKI